MNKQRKKVKAPSRAELLRQFRKEQAFLWFHLEAARKKVKQAMKEHNTQLTTYNIHKATLDTNTKGTK